MGSSLLQQKTGFLTLSAQGQGKQNSYTTFVDKNGLIQVVPRARKSRSLSFAPLKLVLLFAVLVTLFKAAALLNVGASSYGDEIAALKNGNGFEQAGAFILQIDPVTQTIVNNAGALLK